MDARKWHMVAMILVMVCINGFTVPLLLERIGLEGLVVEGSPEAQRVSLSVKVLEVWAAMSLGLMWRRKSGIGGLVAGSASYCLASLVAVILFMLFSNALLPGRLTVLRLLIPLAALYLLARWLHLVLTWSAERDSRRWLQSTALVFAAVMAVSLVMEGVFMFVGKSSQNDNALASKVWFARHWEVNAQGYRDLPDEEGGAGKRHLLLVGDSYLAGHGVADSAERFSNRMQRALGRWRIHNHGQNGASAEDIAGQLELVGAKADVVLYCWFVNDILGPARDFLPPRHADLRPRSPLSPIGSSYLFNYLHHLYPDEADGRDYYDYLRRCYQSADVMRAYHAVLEGIAGKARHGNSQFGVVLFPTMDLSQMEGIPVAEELAFWKGLGVPCIYLGPAIEGQDASELIVNGSDHHPNSLGHQLAADAILKWLREIGWVD